MNLRDAAKPSRFMTAAEVADHLRIHLNTLYKLLRSGQISGFKIGSDYRFDREEIEKLMRDRQAMTPKKNGPA
jgi:excisionase family DNA binding protein